MEYVWETGRLSVPAGIENEKKKQGQKDDQFLGKRNLTEPNSW